MTYLLHHHVLLNAQKQPSLDALGYRQQWFSYLTVSQKIRSVAAGLQRFGLPKLARVGVYLPKIPESVFSIFGTTAAGATVVPINPALKPRQVFYILQSCNVQVLITNRARCQQLAANLEQGNAPNHIIVTDGAMDSMIASSLHWSDFLRPYQDWQPPSSIDTDMAAILYTSGSTGKPKGVVLSHRNMVAGALSVATYLNNNSNDRLLCVLPFSFDYGLSQLTTAFSVGAGCYLHELVFPKDVLKIVNQQAITGLGLVPALWIQLALLARSNVSDGCGDSLRYFTNTGGVMPTNTLNSLRKMFKNARPYMMYGLTESFRSCILPPEQLDERPTSIGKAIPNAEVFVINEQGEQCAPNEPGELVHRGALVSMGYWNDQEKTAKRFRPVPNAIPEIPRNELAVWSGDIVRTDEQGYLYFLGRRDDMIKTSGYRVSPTEVEEVAFSSGLVTEVAAVGVPHPLVGQKIVLIIVAPDNNCTIDSNDLLKHCTKLLPTYMVPDQVIQKKSLKKTPNGKIDRPSLTREYYDTYTSEF